MRSAEENLHALFTHRITLPFVLGHEGLKARSRLLKIIRLKLHKARAVQGLAGKSTRQPGRRLVLRQRLLGLSQFAQRFGQ